MAEITPNMVKDLRDMTGAGMMDCKKALVEADGDIQKAVENLRKSGIAKAEKKAGREAKQGVIASKISGSVGVALEILCETDFVSRNDKFKDFVAAEVEHLLAFDKEGDVSADFCAAEKERVTQMIATTGENMQIRRAVRWKTAGRCMSYLHMGGRIGVLIDAEGEADDALLKDVCMHITVYSPAYASPDVVPADVIAKEKEIAAAQITGKPANIVEKIVSGKVEKWYTDVCLTKQVWFKDEKTCLEKIAPGLKVKRFIRWEVGERV